jgi:hypothetical protein
MRCSSQLRFLALHIAERELTYLYILIEYCRLLEELQLRYFQVLDDGLLVRLVSSLPHLRELMLMNCCVRDKVLIAIAMYLPNLTTLGLIRSCETYCTKVGAQALVTSLTQLQRFCIGADETYLFTPALRQHWQEALPGLKINGNLHAVTRYFQRLHMRWY